MARDGYRERLTACNLSPVLYYSPQATSLLTDMVELEENLAANTRVPMYPGAGLHVFGRLQEDCRGKGQEPVYPDPTCQLLGH